MAIEPLGCHWYEQLVATAEAKSGPLHGLMRIKPDGSAEPVTMNLYPSDPVLGEPEDLVAISDGYAYVTFALGDHLALVGVAYGENMSIVVDDEVAYTLDRQDDSSEDSSFVYAVKSPGGWTFRYFHTKVPYVSPQTVVVDVPFSSPPRSWIKVGDEFFIGSSDQLLRVYKDKSFAWVNLQGGGALTSFRAEPPLLFCAVGYGSNVAGSLDVYTMSDTSVSWASSMSIAEPGAMCRFTDMTLTDFKAIALMTREGLFKFDATAASPSLESVFASPEPTAKVPFLRLGHLPSTTAYHYSADKYWFSFDIRCNEEPIYRPVRLESGALIEGLTEENIHLLTGELWTSDDTMPGAPRLYGNSSGIFIIAD